MKRRLAGRALGTAVLCGIAALSGGVTFGAFNSTTTNAGSSFDSGTVAVADNDAGTAVVGLSGVRPGAAADTGCIQITSTGTLDSSLRHYATLTGNATLQSNLQLKITRGRDPSPSFDSCTGFTPDACNYAGQGDGVIYSGTLAALPTTYAAGIADPAGCSGYPDAVAASNAKSHWRLDETAGTTTADSRGTNPGTISGSPTLNAAGAIAGNGAIAFDGVNDYVRTARQIGDDFTIELWFRSTQTLGTSGNWYDGAGLVDAEVAGSTNDFGLSLNGGRVMAGTGNPDVTLSSATGFDDNQWHHVAFTRIRSSGALRLYVDGALVDSDTGSTAALSASSFVDLGRIQTGVNYFAGTLDEVAVYESALGAGAVTEHFEARGDGTPSGFDESWSPSEKHSYRYEISLPSGTPSTVEGTSATATFNYEARNR